MSFFDVQGTIDRRILVNYRIDPDVLARLLPRPFEPQLVDGSGIAGICLIRLKHIRPTRFPARFGLASENAALRIAARWRDRLGEHTGVFIPRRDTSSRLNCWAGGRVFPGMHHLSQFDIRETYDRFEISMRSDSQGWDFAIAASVAKKLPPSSIFRDVESARHFFEMGSVGYSVTDSDGRFDGLKLNMAHWSLEPLAVERLNSQYFEDHAKFPHGTTQFDCALLMRGVEHRWQRQPAIVTADAARHVCC